jgi:multiple sugar transport system substrate-binding protein
MNMKRAGLFGLYVVLFMVAGFSVWAGGGAERNEGSGGKIPILVWTGTRSDLSFREQKIEEFNRKNPNIEVKMEVFTDNYLSTLELAFASGQAPDIFLSVDNNATYYVERNMAIPLDKYITPENRARFGDLYSIDLVNTVDGNIYTLTERGVTYRLLYNQDIFDALGISGPPKSLEELYDYSKRITDWGKKDGIYGFGVHLQTPFSVGERIIDQIAYRNGISPYDFKTGAYNYAVMKPVLAVFQRMYAEGIMFPGIEGLSIDPLRAQFADGKVAMYFNGSWEPTLYAPDGQFPNRNNWNAAPLPGIGAAAPAGRMDVRGAGKSFMISSTSKNPDAAWKYLEYILSDDYLAEYHEKGLGFVIIPSVAAKAKAPDIRGWAECTINPAVETSWPLRPDQIGLQIEGRNAYDTYASIILGAVNIDSALADQSARYNAALNRAVTNGTMKRIINTSFNPAAR